ncbi:DUF4387 domain-containing protein [Halobacteria archaeon AArc-curdl1]|uniref:DUF4387 domain-containing protein n=1 Tax=Natronosalvus hydrolyticus TaxID=2979988 RepID=A0AAP2Z8Q9_9EURY|nr:DUF4387 domain-containing protein [Halobacteria archaeon AArc-curdl1]
MSTTQVPISKVCKTIRSKNAGIDQITFDIIFEDKDIYDYVKSEGLISKKTILEIYGIEEERMSVFVYFDPAKAVKFTLNRTRASGNPGEHDLYGSQQYPPLFNIELELPDEILET